MKKKILIGLKILITMLVIWWVIHKLGPGGLQKLAEQVRHSNPVFLFLALVAAMFVLFLGTWRWRTLLKIQGIEVSAYRAFWMVSVGVFFNAFLIGATGGDVLKAVYAAEAAPDKKAHAVLSIVIDRIIGLLGLLTLASLCVLFYLPVLWANANTRPLALGVVGISVCALFGLALTTQRRWITSQSWWVKVMELVPGKATLEKLSESYDLYARKPKALALALMISMCVHISGVISAWCVGLALGIEKVAFGHYLLYCPIINAFAALPISVGGLGLREGAYQFFFGLQGVSQVQAAALGFLYYVVSTPLLSLLCGILYLVGKPSVALASPAVIARVDASGAPGTE